MTVRERPSIAEMRARAQPPGLLERRSGEHWMGRLYLRRFSVYFSRHLVGTGTAPNAITAVMIVVGLVGGVTAAFVPGILGALLTVVLIQAYMLLDCIDGEVARFTGRISMTGVFLDRIGHYLCEAGLLVALGFRAADGDLIGGYPMLGLAAALGAILIKSETDLVHVARAAHGAPAATDEAAAPRSGGIATLRRLAQATQFHRVILAAELSLLILVAAVIDAAVGGAPYSEVPATRVLVVACAVVAGVQTVLHLFAILASKRLR